MFKSVAEGLLYTHVVEEYLNKEVVYVNIRKAAIDMWHEIEENHKWLNTTLKRSVYQGKTPRKVLQSFANKAQEIVNTFNASTGEKIVEMENLPAKVILANSMFCVANTVMHAYNSKDLESTEHELFEKLSSMISHIIAACLTNLPCVIRLKCEEKTLSSVADAADRLGKTSKIVDILERRAPNMDREKMAYIDEWRFHLRQL